MKKENLRILITLVCYMLSFIPVGMTCRHQRKTKPFLLLTTIYQHNTISYIRGVFVWEIRLETLVRRSQMRFFASLFLLRLPQHVRASPAKVTSATLLPTPIYQHNTISYIRGVLLLNKVENEVFCISFFT
jgi:hypothetical protein